MRAPRGAPARGESALAFLALVAVLAVALGFLVSAIPLAPVPTWEFVSTYGVVDNRRLLLRYGACILAALLAPVILQVVRSGHGQPVGSPSTSSPASPRPGHTSPLRRDLVLAGILILVFGFLFVGPGVALRPLNGHELVHLGYLNEIAHGRLLNVDARITYGPLLGYSIFGFMKAVSFSLVGFRLYWNVVTAIFLALFMLVARPQLTSRGLWLLLGFYLSLFTVARYYLPASDGTQPGLWGWANLARQGWAPLLILALAPKLVSSEGKGTRLVAGAICGLGVSYAQETGLPALASMAVLCAAGIPHRTRGPFLRDLLLLAAGFLVSWAAALLPAAFHGIVGSYLRATGAVGTLFLKGAGNLPYPEFLGRDHSGHAALLPYYVFPGLLILAVALEVRALLSGDRVRGVTAALALYGATSYVNVIVRADSLHVVNVVVAPLLYGFLTLDRLCASWSRTINPPARATRARISLLVALSLPLLAADPGLKSLATGAYGRARWFLPRPREGWQVIPTDRGGIWTPPGDWFDSKEWGGEDDSSSVALVRRLTRGRPTFISGSKSSLLYFLGDAPAAVRFTDLSSQCLTPEDYRQLGQDLARNRPEFVFVIPGFAGARPGPANRYRFLGIHAGLEVYQREDLSIPVLPSGEGSDQDTSGVR